MNDFTPGNTMTMYALTTDCLLQKHIRHDQFNHINHTLYHVSSYKYETWAYTWYSNFEELHLQLLILGGILSSCWVVYPLSFLDLLPLSCKPLLTFI